MWQELPLENYVSGCLKQKLGQDGVDLWAKYAQTRTEMVSEVIKWIRGEEPYLTDHGEDHIADVIGNAALLLGFSNHYGEESSWVDSHGFSPQELIVLLSGLLLHDVGNIYKRNSHNQKIPDVLKGGQCSWKQWTDQQRDIIVDVGRAHSGETSKGEWDTLAPLATGKKYFGKVPVRAAEIAAIIRFADELAEGPQRTSTFLINQGLILKEDTKLYHFYAQVTQQSIDYNGGRVALTYEVNIDNEAYPKTPKELRSHLEALLKMIYKRAVKLNYERHFARHYANALNHFRETSVSLSLRQGGVPLDLGLEPIVMSDMSLLKDSNFSIENADEAYGISKLLDRVKLT